jgi:streptogramin lyase
MKKISGITVLLAFHLFSFSQENLSFQRFGIEQGLTVTTAFTIVQDDNGFLWVSTIDGLARFDGYKFTTYKNDFNDSLSLSDNTLSTIYKDKNGNFWIGTYNEGVNCFDPRTGRSKRYDAKASNPNRLSNGRYGPFVKRVMERCGSVPTTALTCSILPPER